MSKEAKPADLRAKTPDELQTMLLSLRKTQFNLRFQRATGQLEGLGAIIKARLDAGYAQDFQTTRNFLARALEGDLLDAAEAQALPLLDGAHEMHRAAVI